MLKSKNLFAGAVFYYFVFAVAWGCFLTASTMKNVVFAQEYSENKSENTKALTQPNTNPGLTAEQREKAVLTLRHALEEQERWRKVHAAEHLIALDYPQGVVKEFTKELEKNGDKPGYRIGVWSVLALASMRRENREQWINEILEVSLDETAPDQEQAIEALGKLGVSLNEIQLAPIEAAAKKTDLTISVYAQWVLLNSGRGAGAERLAKMLDSKNPAIRDAAANVLSYLKRV